MSYEENIKKYYGIKFFQGLGFSGVIFILFLQANGLNYFQIMLLEAWFALMVLISLIPVGVVADLWSRKNILLIGTITGVMGSIIYAISSSFVYFLIAEAFIGISMAITSGTTTSFIYESLKCATLQDMSKKVFSHGTFYFTLGGIIAPPIGSFVASAYSLRMPLYLSIIPSVINFFLVLMLEEPIRIKGILKETFFENIKDAVKFIVKNDLLRFILSINIVIALIFWMGEMYYQPYMQNVGIKIVLFGFIFAAINMASAIFSREAHWIEESLGMKKTLIISTLIPAIGYLAMALLFDPIVAVIGIAMIKVTNRFMEPVYADYYNKLIGSKNRATINSFTGFVFTLSFVVISPVLGHFSDVIGTPIVFLSFSVVAFLLTIYAGVKFINIK